MTDHCPDLVLFVDGELDPERAEAFRDHLATCSECRIGLVQAMQLNARLSLLEPEPQEAPQAEPHATPAESPDVVPVRGVVSPARRWRRRLILWGGGTLAPAAFVTYVVMMHAAKPPPRAPNAFADLKSRPYDVRFALADAAGYRPLQATLGAGGGDGRTQNIPQSALAAYETAGDRHALAIGLAWNRAKLVDVAKQLTELPPSSPVRSDHAAIEVMATSNENIESVLTDLEALRDDRDIAVARAARWNYALVLSRLRLPLSAARAFRDIAGEHEAGWSEEALDRARSQESAARELKDAWDRAKQAGLALSTGGPLVPDDLVERFPGMTRAYFYNAVRTAPDRERVRALGAMADVLDRIAGRPVLRDYVQRVAALDFHRRAPLAAAYARLLGNESLDAKLTAELTTDHPSPDIADIVMGAMVQLDAVPDHLATYRELTRNAADHWFEILLAQGEAERDRRHGDWFAAEVKLRNAQKLCSPEIQYRCLFLDEVLGHLYQDLHRIPDALQVLRDGLRVARTSGEWGRVQELLMRTADTERFNSSNATARAYANELVLMAPIADRHTRIALAILAEIAIHNLDGRAARRILDQAARYSDPELADAIDLGDIARLDPQPGDQDLLRGVLLRLRKSERITQAERITTDELEGSMILQSDPAAGTAALERAIAASNAAGEDPIAQEARAAAYSALGFDAARQDRHDRVLSLMAEQLRLPAPGPCTVAMLAEDERTAIAVRSSEGPARGIYRRRHTTDGPVTVPADLARGLEACDHVGVMAQPAVQGRPDILPRELAWSYLTDARARDAAPGQPTSPPRAVIIADVNPPSYLQLDSLSPWPADATGTATLVSADSATPTRVLREIRTATEIHFHTHAIVNAALSDASHLVLSPDANGNYALTAEALRHVTLANRPIVVLAACDSAQGAGLQHRAWSLPYAFVAAGARAVFASASKLPDREAIPFYTRVLDQIRTGSDPARVLRDERMKHPSDWIANVILFE